MCARSRRDLAALGGFVALARILDSGLLLADAHVDIAAELNVGAAAGHVGGDGDRAGHAGLGDDEGFLLVIAGVQDGEHFRLGGTLVAGEPAMRSGREVVLLPAVRRSISASCSDFSIETVPTRIGWPRCLAVLDLAR